LRLYLIVCIPKGDAEEGKRLGDKVSSTDAKNIPAASKRRPGLSGLDFDEESISNFNMPATSTRVARKQGEGSSTGQTNQRQQKSPQIGQRPGLMARLVSRLASPSNGSGREHHRWPRAIKLVSMGRATMRNLAAGDASTARNRAGRRHPPQDDGDDDDSTSPSPAQSARGNSPPAGAGDDASRASSEVGCFDFVRYCLCFTC